MTIREIIEDNINDYLDLIPLEYTNNIGREYVEGLAGENDITGEIRAAMLWELKNVEDETQPTMAEIQWFYAADEASGKDLLSAFDENVKEKSVRRVLFEMPQLSSQEKAAFAAAGYSVGNGEGRSIYVSVSELTDLSFAKKEPLDCVRPLSEITSRQFKSGIMNCVYRKRYGLCDDLPFLPVTRYDLDVSCCVIQDGRIAGFLLIHRPTSEILRPELLFATEPDSSLLMVNMMRFSIQAAVRTSKENERVEIKRYNEATLKLAKKLFPNKKGEMIVRGIKKYK